MKNVFFALLICTAAITVQAQTPTDTVKITLDNYIDFTEPTIKFNQPLCFLNGEKFSIDSLRFIKPDSIESIEVLKGQKAEDAYGEKGKNGVVVITLKGIRKKED